jgi:hypothetical protein
MGIKQNLLALIGNIPKDGSNKFKNRQRFHQSWWRTVVLGEEEGQHPNRKNERVGNTIPLVADADNSYNFLSLEAYEDAQDAIKTFKQSQSQGSGGIIQEERLYGNLLSSQPLAFNFWATIKHNPDLANQLLPAFISDFKSFVDLKYEWSPAPKQNYTNDHSAFDVLIIYCNQKDQTAYWGLEVKYTDSFSAKAYSTPAYQAIFNNRQHRFKQQYSFYTQSRYNQLFRNELIACAVENNNSIPVICGLFCHGEDKAALAIAADYAQSLNSPFLIITYQDFIEAVQKLDIDWEVRQWSMLLWARYVATDLSKALYHFQQQNPNSHKHDI